MEKSSAAEGSVRGHGSGGKAPKRQSVFPQILFPCSVDLLGDDGTFSESLRTIPASPMIKLEPVSNTTNEVPEHVLRLGKGPRLFQFTVLYHMA